MAQNLADMIQAKEVVKMLKYTTGQIALRFWDVSVGMYALFKHEGRMLAMFNNRAYVAVHDEGKEVTFDTETRNIGLGEVVLANTPYLMYVRELVRTATAAQFEALCAEGKF